MYNYLKYNPNVRHIKRHLLRSILNFDSECFIIFAVIRAHKIFEPYYVKSNVGPATEIH